MSFRTKQSVVKNLVDIHVDALEILRFALDDKKEKTQWNSVLLCGEKNTRVDDKGKGSFGL